MPDPETTLTEPVEKPDASLTVEKPDPLAEIQRQLAVEKAGREKAERDLSSLRGTVRSQRELDESVLERLAGLDKQFEVLAKGLVRSEDAEKVPEELAQLRAQSNANSQARSLQSEYTRLSEEFKAAIAGEDGKPLFDVDAAPELEEARRLWLAGKTGMDGATPLSTDRRVTSLMRAIAEAQKASVRKERTLAVTAREAEKAERAAARKKQVEESGELDLDTGGAGGTAGSDVSKLSPREKIAAGLAAARKAGKKSSLDG